MKTPCNACLKELGSLFVSFHTPRSNIPLFLISLIPDIPYSLRGVPIVS
jgi:hypothetical protein